MAIGNKKKALELWLIQANNKCAIHALTAYKETKDEKFKETADWFINQNTEIKKQKQP